MIHRHLRLAVPLFLLVVPSLAAAGSATAPKRSQPKTVRAERFELTDSSGRVRAVLEMRDGQPMLSMCDARGNERVSIGVASDGASSVIIRDSEGFGRGGLVFVPGTGASLSLNDGRGGSRALLYLAADGTASLRLKGARGAEQACMSAGGKWANGVFLWDEAGTPRARFSIYEDLPLVATMAKDGSVAWSSALASLPLSTGLPSQPTLPGVGGFALQGRSSGTYWDTGGGHWIQEVTGSGKYIQLEDDSLWEVSPLDTMDTALWLATTDITVVDSDDALYPYRLINTDDGETAEARLVSR